MSEYSDSIKNLAVELFEINAFKFGDFKMKIGINSPIYFDLRVIVSHPELMAQVSNLMNELVDEKKMEFNHLCGVPYTALPIATIMSVEGSYPMLIRRKEAKSYGTKKLIEGKYNAGDVCLIIEDVVTSGSSIMETVRDLRSEGIIVNDAIVVVDREQGGVKIVEDNDVRMHSLFTLSFLLKTLENAGKITKETVDAVSNYISAQQIKVDSPISANISSVKSTLVDRTKMTFAKRAHLSKSPVAQTLFNIMEQKKTNLCVAADLTKTADILNLVEKIGQHICVLKMHIDAVEDFNEHFITSLKSLAKTHNFLIMEDRKFADIGNTVSLQYNNGIFKISDWADLVTVHAIAGESIVKGLKSGLTTSDNRGVVFVAEMSSQGNLITDQYTKQTMNIVTDNIDFVSGIVCQNKGIVDVPGLIQMTPGVKIDEDGDQLGQQYNTPELVVIERGADIGIVGRGIIASKNVEATAEIYRERLWQSYLERIGESD